MFAGIVVVDATAASSKDAENEELFTSYIGIEFPTVLDTVFTEVGRT